MKILAIFICGIVLLTKAYAGEGALALTTTPKEAEIFVDGQLKANSTPVVLKLPEGKHLIEIKKTGKQSQSLEILMTDGAVLSKKITLADLAVSADNYFIDNLAPKRDPLETDAEFFQRRQRLLDQFNQASKQQFSTHQAGMAYLSADNYDVKRGSFSVFIDWQPWAMRFKQREKNNFAVQREAVKALLEEGQQKPIFLQFAFDPEQPLLTQKPIIKEITLVGIKKTWSLDKSATKEGGMAGYLKMATIAPLTQLFLPLAEKYQQKYPHMHLDVKTTSLAQAWAKLTAGTVHFVPMIKKATSSETKDFMAKYGYEPTGFRVALNILAIYVHRDNPVILNTPQQIDAIFSRTRHCGYEKYLTHWEDTWVRSWAKKWVGLGLDYWGKKFSGPIKVIIEKNTNSLDSLLFKELALCGGQFKSSTVTKATTLRYAIARVAYDPMAVTFGHINSNIKEVRAVPLMTETLPVGYEGISYGTDFIEPTVSNAKQGHYPLASFIWIYVNEKSPKEALSYLEKAFIQLVRAKIGQYYFKEQGLIPLH